MLLCSCHVKVFSFLKVCVLQGSFSLLCARCCNPLFPQPPSHVSLSNCRISPHHLILLNSRTFFFLFPFSCIRPDSSPPLSSLSFPFYHCLFLLLPLFFFYSHLNYNGRGRVFPLQGISFLLPYCSFLPSNAYGFFFHLCANPFISLFTSSSSSSILLFFPLELQW